MLRRFLRRGRLRAYSDEQLVRNFSTFGREEYFDELFERYYALVYGLCLQVTKHREDSKDLTLITFEKAYAEIIRRPPQRFDHWLFTLCRNECRRHLRNLRVEKMRLQNADPNREIQQQVTENEAFRHEIYEQELLEDQLLRAGLDTLSVEQKRCLELFIYERKSYREITVLTGLDVRQVQSHLQNGRLKLKRWFERKKGQ